MALLADRKQCTLFGGDKGWNANDWAASDDRVRGGKSQSYFDCGDDLARFHGTLDIKTLGGAGFASQRTSGDDRSWDLSDYAGIQINVAEGDKKRYTFNLKDELLSPDPSTGREQASVTYECDFELPPQSEPGNTRNRSVFLPWNAFNATYRGKPQKDAKPIDLSSVKRVSVMIRSFFGTQEGDFSLSIRSIVALPEAPKSPLQQQSWNFAAPELDPAQLEKGSLSSFEATRAGSATSPANVYRAFTGLILAVMSLMAVYSFAGKWGFTWHC